MPSAEWQIARPALLHLEPPERRRSVMKGDVRPGDRHEDVSELVPANDNIPTRLHAQIEAPTAPTANDSEADIRTRAVANDDAPVTTPVAANDNGILLTDDFPLPLPLMPGESEMVRKLLGGRFRKILLGGNS
jgi:hypothetical protein